MTNPKPRYRFIQDGSTCTISDQLAINKKELLIYPIPLFFFLSLILIFLFHASILPGILLSLLLSSFIGGLYAIFRFSAWIFYKEIELDYEKGILKITKKTLNSIRNVSIISEKYDKQKITFQEHIRGGQVKYTLRYCNHRIYDLLVIDNVEDKNEIERIFLNK